MKETYADNNFRVYKALSHSFLSPNPHINPKEDIYYYCTFTDEKTEAKAKKKINQPRLV
jgi:hypothetical protein